MEFMEFMEFMGFMEQLQFGDSTQRADSDGVKKSAKS